MQKKKWGKGSHVVGLCPREKHLLVWTRLVAVEMDFGENLVGAVKEREEPGITCRFLA